MKEDFLNNQRLISKLSNSAIQIKLFDLTKTQILEHILIYDGKIFGFGGEDGMILSCLMNRHFFYYSWYEKFSKELLKKYVECGILEPRYQKHPYHKIDVFEGYEKGKNYEEFKQQYENSFLDVLEYYDEP